MTTKLIKLLDVNIQVGIDKGDMPDLTSAPSSLLDALQDHLNSLEGNHNFATINGKIYPKIFRQTIRNSITNNTSFTK